MTRRQEKRLRRDLEVKQGDLVRQLRLRMEALAVEDGGDRMDRLRRMEERNSTTGDVSRLTGVLHSVGRSARKTQRGLFRHLRRLRPGSSRQEAPDPALGQIMRFLPGRE